MIPSRRIFDVYANDYDRWSDEHDDVNQAQLRLLRGAVPDHGLSLEVGVASGRFAVPLGICCGIDPSSELAQMAKHRGRGVVLGEGEHLPYRADSFDCVLMMTVICFLEDVVAVFHKTYRVLRQGGYLSWGLLKRAGKFSGYITASQQKGGSYGSRNSGLLKTWTGFLRIPDMRRFPLLKEPAGSVS